jgi:hypothetical protein
MRVILASVLAVLAFRVAATEPGIPMVFWAGPGAEDFPGVTLIEDHHACSGRIAVATVAKIPLPSEEGALQPERVEELNEAGEVVQTWPMPVDSYVAAIEGEAILVRPLTHPDGNALRIDRSGEYAPKSLGQVMDADWVECPPRPNTDESAYRRCFLFKDTVSGEKRLVSYDGPCT